MAGLAIPVLVLLATCFSDVAGEMADTTTIDEERRLADTTTGEAPGATPAPTPAPTAGNLADTTTGSAPTTTGLAPTPAPTAGNSPPATSGAAVRKCGAVPLLLALLGCLFAGGCRAEELTTTMDEERRLADTTTGSAPTTTGSAPTPAPTAGNSPPATSGGAVRTCGVVPLLLALLGCLFAGAPDRRGTRARSRVLH